MSFSTHATGKASKLKVLPSASSPSKSQSLEDTGILRGEMKKFQVLMEILLLNILFKGDEKRMPALLNTWERKIDLWNRAFTVICTHLRRHTLLSSRTLLIYWAAAYNGKRVNEVFIEPFLKLFIIFFFKI